MGIAAEIGEDLGWAAEWWFGIDHPFDLAQRPQLCCKGIQFSEARQIAEEAKLASFECALQR